MVANDVTGRLVVGSSSVSRSFDAPRPPGPAVTATSIQYSPSRGGGIGTSSIRHSGHLPAVDDRMSGCIGHQNASGASMSRTISTPTVPVLKNLDSSVCLHGVAPWSINAETTADVSALVNAT